MAAEGIVHANKDNWQSEVVDSSVPVLVDFWAEWCGPCLAITPVLEELSGELSGKLKIAKVNVDEAPELAEQFGIRSIPTLLVLRGGTVQGQMVGAMPKAALKSKLEPFLGG
ncbi:MAG: thioredoxin [Kiritimatiellae bacterium]|nr:thioredoxin [Kiritimatiellia bacterium]